MVMDIFLYWVILISIFLFSTISFPFTQAGWLSPVMILAFKLLHNVYLDHRYTMAGIYMSFDIFINSKFIIIIIVIVKSISDELPSLSTIWMFFLFSCFHLITFCTSEVIAHLHILTTYQRSKGKVMNYRKDHKILL